MDLVNFDCRSECGLDDSEDDDWDVSEDDEDFVDEEFCDEIDVDIVPNRECALPQDQLQPQGVQRQSEDEQLKEALCRSLSEMNKRIDQEQDIIRVDYAIALSRQTCMQEPKEDIFDWTSCASGYEQDLDSSDNDAWEVSEDDEGFVDEEFRDESDDKVIIDEEYVWSSSGRH